MEYSDAHTTDKILQRRCDILTLTSFGQDEFGQQNLFKVLDLIHFPIQKLAKIFPSKSSAVTCPVISPK